MFSFFRKTAKPKLTPRQEFIKELTDNYLRWSTAGRKEEAEAYLLLLHNFTLPEEPVQEAEVAK